MSRIRAYSNFYDGILVRYVSGLINHAEENETQSESLKKWIIDDLFWKFELFYLYYINITIKKGIFRDSGFWGFGDDGDALFPHCVCADGGVADGGAGGDSC